MTTTFPFHLMPETMTTPRLRLRAPVAADASRIAMFVGDWDVARMLADVPHPYREADAIAWIASLDRERCATYAIVHANGVIGVVGIAQRHNGVVDLGYWLAKPFWGRGLMTEAAKAVVSAARAYERGASITTGHFSDNAAAQRVSEKLGFVRASDGTRHSRARAADVPHVAYRLPLAPVPLVAAPPAFAPA